jgi:hypothetical protein
MGDAPGSDGLARHIARGGGCGAAYRGRRAGAALTALLELRGHLGADCVLWLRLGKSARHRQDKAYGHNLDPHGFVPADPHNVRKSGRGRFNVHCGGSTARRACRGETGRARV